MTMTDNQTNTKQRAMLVGATGLVGSNILHLLVKDSTIGEVRALTRRSLPSQDNSPVVKELIADFERLQDHPEWFEVDMVFCALGTIIAKAKTQTAFRRVDFDYPLAVAKLARSAGARQFLMVSAIGANPRSRFFYNRIKGELEEAILTLGYPSVTIARPSFLLGNRQEYRLGEHIAKKITWLFPSFLAGVEASQVASAMVQAAHQSAVGVTILDNKTMRSIEKEEHQ
jgi:uncharacterized protein YbjT (DUF2867 family)